MLVKASPCTEQAGYVTRLASLRLTLGLLILLGSTVSLTYLVDGIGNAWISLPLVLLAVNLLAAILSKAKFRQQLPLLSFHLALLALVMLAAVGQLTSLNGRVEVTTGELFTGTLTEYEAGPLHHWQLDGIEFLLEGFSIDYAAGLQRGATRSRIKWLDERGTVQHGVFGDHHPLVVNNYHFYTSHNKGFAPIFSWYPKSGGKVTGSIHLPSYPANEFDQALEWTPTGGRTKIWSQLQFDEVILDPSREGQFRIPKDHRMIIRVDDARYELHPGGEVILPEGRLRYDGLRTWMGFTVRHDWTLPWLFAAGLLAVVSMGWHYWRKFNNRPWLEG